MYLPPGKMSEKKRQILQDNHAYLYPGRVQRLADGGVDFVPGEREGYRYWDVDGREIYDLHLNGGTFNLGHRHPELVALMQQAVQAWDIGNHHFPSEPKARLAKALVEACPGDMQYVVFTPSGSEANDVAIKSARHLTGRRKIVALDAGYHGRSGLSGAAGDDEAARYFLSDYPSEFIKVPFNDIGAMEEALRNAVKNGATSDGVAKLKQSRIDAQATMDAALEQVNATRARIDATELRAGGKGVVKEVRVSLYGQVEAGEAVIVIDPKDHFYLFNKSLAIFSFIAFWVFLGIHILAL